MTLAINEMKRNIQTMIDTIKLKFQIKITSKDKHFIHSAIHKLRHLKKANLVQHTNIKQA